jgi:hypothetical protein
MSGSHVTRRPGLSKSRITLYEQCPKRLWLSVHKPELAEQTRTVTAAMSTGHDVGAIACSLLPDGYMIETQAGLAAAVAETSALLADGWDRPLFEATFAHDDVLVRVDLMLPTAGGWHVAEVKSTTGLKPYHLGDLATQLWVMQGCGVRVASASIRHLDRTFTLLRKGDYDGLFADTPVDTLIEPLIAGRSEIVAGARETLLGEEPAREIGAHCDDPFPCAFKGHCGRDLPPGPEWPVSVLPDAAGKKIAAVWAGQGVADLTQVPDAAMTSPKLARVHAATVTGLPYHDPVAIAAETCGWPYPRTFLDFETIQFAVPRWIGTRPYAQVPFQFSAHIVNADDQVSHREYLSLDGSDPRRGCAEALALLPQEGAVVAWNASFERSCLLALAAEFPDLGVALRGLAGRLVDLLPVVRRHYYDRDMRGSWSLKAVLPTIAADLAYDTLAQVRSGTDAQAGYVEAIDPATTPTRREAIRTGLSDYCRRDTEAMMVVLDRLSG